VARITAFHEEIGQLQDITQIRGEEFMTKTVKLFIPGDEFGFQIDGGNGKRKGKSLRVSNMGDETWRTVKPLGSDDANDRALAITTGDALFAALSGPNIVLG
jgi:hypothetical protein